MHHFPFAVACSGFFSLSTSVHYIIIYYILLCLCYVLIYKHSLESTMNRKNSVFRACSLVRPNFHRRRRYFVVAQQKCITICAVVAYHVHIERPWPPLSRYTCRHFWHCIKLCHPRSTSTNK